MDLSHGTTFPHVDDLVFFVLCVFFLSMRPYIYIIIYLWTDKKAQNFFLVMGADAFQEVKPAPNPIMSSRSRLSAGGGRTALVVHAPSSLGSCLHHFRLPRS